MPYRRAHWWLIALLATIPIAFWPNYFAPAAHRTPALHAHAAAATLWLLLLTVQSRSAATRRFPLHRAAGRALFAAVPLFAGAGALAIVDLARRFAEAVTPFHIANGARLVPCDALVLACFVALTGHAVAERRRVRAHAAAMLATPLLVLSPIVGRLLQHVPGFPVDGAFGTSGFALAFYGGQALAAGIALHLYRGDPRHGGAFVVVVAASLGQVLLYSTIGGSARWAEIVRGIAGWPMPAVGLLALLAAAVAVVIAWIRPAPRPLAVAPA